MGRPKGSKNKPKVAAVVNLPKFEPQTKPRPPEDTSPVQAPATAEAQAAYDATMKVVEAQRIAYRVNRIAPHTEVKLKRILTGIDSVTIQQYVDKATTSAYMWCLGEWAVGNSPGPETALNKFTAILEAVKAEKLADFLDKRGKHDNATSQRERALELRELAKRLDYGTALL